MGKSCIMSMKFDRKYSACINVEHSTWTDIKEYCRDHNITVSSLVDRLFTEVLEKDKRTTDS